MAINHGTLNNCTEMKKSKSEIYSYHDIACSSFQMREREKYKVREKKKKVLLTYPTYEITSPAICIRISIKCTYIKML